MPTFAKDSEAASPAESSKPGLDRKEQKRLEAEARQRLAPLKKSSKMRKRLEELGAHLAAIEEKNG